MSDGITDMNIEIDRAKRKEYERGRSDMAKEILDSLDSKSVMDDERIGMILLSVNAAAKELVRKVRDGKHEDMA